MEFEFDDVVKCRDVASFSLFVRLYLAERNISVPSEVASKHFWALFYRWRESMFARVSVG